MSTPDPRERVGGPARNRLSALSQEDWQLSMRLSPRARQQVNNEGLRSLLIHRLDDAWKAAMRWSLRNGQYSVHCEHCETWFRVSEPQLAWTCPDCGRRYTAELIIYTEEED